MHWPSRTDRWLMEDHPRNGIVISSRARIARNLPDMPFAPRANDDQLEQTARKLAEAFAKEPMLADMQTCNLIDLSALERTYLRESHLISKELEKGGTGRMVCLSDAMDLSIMINEEDHLRVSRLISGFRLGEVYGRLAEIEAAIERVLKLAYSDEFGYLTACPTNTGTGLRLSVMLHLPALVMIGQVDDLLAPLNSYGLVSRGAQGENSEHLGDLYQVSNEMTLGKDEEEIREILEQVIRQIIEREQQAREALLREAGDRIEDAVCRAVGILSSARRIDSAEALALLSRLRLGIDQDWGVPLTHTRLNRLFLEIQPAHLQMQCGVDAPADQRDASRAAYLRAIMKGEQPEG